MVKTETEPVPTHRVIKPFSSGQPHLVGDFVDASGWLNVLALERTAFIVKVGEAEAVIMDRIRQGREVVRVLADSKIKDAAPGELAAAMQARDRAAAVVGSEPSRFLHVGGHRVRNDDVV